MECADGDSGFLRSNCEKYRDNVDTVVGIVIIIIIKSILFNIFVNFLILNKR